MAPTIPELNWRSLSAAIDEIKTPNGFLKQLLFSQEQTLFTESVEYDLLTGSRDAAPLVKKNSKSIMVSGYGQTFQVVEAPNIRISRPMEASQMLFKRFPGTSVFPTPEVQQAAIQQYIAMDLRRLAEMRDNSIEWLCAQALQGTITYQVDEQEAISIVYPKPSGNNITLTTFWDQANSHPEDDVYSVKKLIADIGLPVTDAICGDAAASVFKKHADLAAALDNRNMTAGQLDLTQQFTALGAIFLGRIYGINWWSYPRTTNLDGSSVALIRDKYVEFVSATPAAQWLTYFAAIPDFDAIEQGVFVGRSFVKSWVEKDPSAYMSLLHSRPLPVPRRPGAGVSMKVVSG